METGDGQRPREEALHVKQRAGADLMETFMYFSITSEIREGKWNKGAERDKHGNMLIERNECCTSVHLTKNSVPYIKRNRLA